MEPYIEQMLSERAELPEKPRRRSAKKTKPAKAKRFAGIDIVKITACFLVTAVHFFLHSEFYQTPITQDFGRVHIYFRWICYCCVPLFMITTGYLMKNKTLSGKYYKGILRVLILYNVISLICAVFQITVLKVNYSGWTLLRGLLHFNADPYAWYVEYYITLFLLIPFLNAGYHALKTRRAKHFLLGTVFLLTFVSQSLYIGTDYDTQIRLMPGYFLRWYSVAYYFIGVYIREYPPRRDWMHKTFYLVIYMIALIWVSGSSFHQSLQNADAGYVFRSWHYDDYGAWPVALMSTMLFLLLFDIPCSSRLAAGVLQKLSNATFAAYLISYIFDALFYRRLNTRVTEPAARFKSAPATILGVFFCSMLSGLLIQGIYDAAKKQIGSRIHSANKIP